MTPDVLLVTHSGDFFTIDRVEEALRRRGAEPLRLDTDLFPTQIELSARLGTDPGSDRLVTDHEGSRIDVSEVSAVWLRRLWTPQIDEGLDPEHRMHCIRESMAFCSSWLRSLEDVFWVNDPVAGEAAEDKLWQLRAARAAGLAIPDTLVTNQPDRVRTFFEQHDGRIVTKMMTPYSYGMSGTTPFVYTSRVAEEDLDHLDGLELCPMIFQEMVPKDIELRVAIVGDHAFAGGIDASGTTEGQDDWRRSVEGETEWQPSQLPHETAAGLIKVVRELGLVYGAADLIRRPDGEHLFLEVNPSGEWGMLERDLDLPISQAFADALLQPPAGR